ncbi:recombination-associated protein RdgC [Litchfieldella xinjiangensis]|uniref:recombination-associated protein RdgC n=1 Tax=Litchfieldella xinjiangensis TaxID=1166948 RepID=UPI0005BE46F3|nr:recombination-associated protein RdgC [Halomonas xinjiangensis]
MWFKNLHLYRWHDAPDIDLDALEDALIEHAYRPLGGSEARRLGWCPPAGRQGVRHVHEVQGHRLLATLRQERLLPAGVVREEVESRAADREAAEGRPLPRKEKQALKEQVYEEFLPRAFVRSQRVELWWDTRRSLIGINTSSRKRAEEMLDLLRQTLGSLKVTPLATQTLPIRAMTTWLTDIDARPPMLTLGDQVELKAKGDDGVLRARQVDLDSDEIQNVLAGGREATKLAIHLEGHLSLTLHDDLALKGLRFDDKLLDEASQADDGGDAILRLETDFVLMAQALATTVEQLIDWLGGESQAAASPLSSDAMASDAP